ncbi:hypothetical protein ACFE04_030690 [Oxalis oulophora]
MHPSFEIIVEMTKSNAATASAAATTPPYNVPDSPENFGKSDKKKKSIIPKIFSSRKRRSKGSLDEEIDTISSDFEKKLTARRDAFSGPVIKKSFSDRETSSGIKGLNLSNFDDSIDFETYIQEYRIYVATWNVAGKTPNNGLDLEDFLLSEGSADIYVCGFQEIVPLSAGNVLVSEDNQPAAKWLGLISKALNKPHPDPESNLGFGSRYNNTANSKDSKQSSSHNIFHKSSTKENRNYRADSSLLKTCNCAVKLTENDRWKQRKTVDVSSKVDVNFRPVHDNNVVVDLLSIADHLPSSPGSPNPINYRLVASKQMVGLFLSVWARRELVPYIAHLRITSLGRGIMGYLGNKGSISLSMSLHQTKFCFVCCHLASGEKEGDEQKRNSDVVEILKSTQFQNICRNPISRAPEKIMDHDRVIWLGDLNYRMALSYDKTRALLEENDWETLLESDQLNIEKGAGRVFGDFKEGRIVFAPTYKYSHNSDSYAGETGKSKRKRRTPAWCDRILWHGEGIEQLSYIRGESRFSDHRPVCAVFQVEVEATRSKNSRFRKGYSCAGSRLKYDDCIPQRHSFCEYKF